MRYGGAGETAVHPTQISVSAALLNRGHPLDEVVATVLAATRVAAGQHADSWNWRREEREVRRMCVDWLGKHPEISEREQEKEFSDPKDQSEETAQAQESAQATGTDDVISLAKERASRQQKTKSKSKGSPNAAPIAIVEGVIDIVRKAGGDLLLTAGDLHLYSEGIWRGANGGDVQWLRCLIQQGSQALGEGAKLGVVNAAWKRLVEHPDLHRVNVAWDPRGVVALANGVLDLRTRKFGEWSPELYLRRKLGVAYDPTVACPKFLEFMAFLFTQLKPAAAEDTIALLQEFFGGCLAVSLLNRENRRALLLNGPSRTGKTEVARIIHRLVGDPIATPAVSEIGERFGTATFYGATAWIRDDAINEGDRIDPERFKTIVTGEAIDIERKNCPPLRDVSLEIPVVLTTNSLPTSRDSSDAIFNRSLVIEMAKVISEETAVDEARHHYGVPIGEKLGDWIFSHEGPGILNWALEGLARLLTRGRYDIPEPVRDAIQSFKDSSNPVSEWARTMLIRSDHGKIERGDLLCAFHGWWREEMGDDVRLLGGRWLMPKLRAACPWIGTTNTMGTRYVTGIELNAEGLKFWQRQSSDAAQRGHGSRGAASSADAVNKDWAAS